MDQRFGHVGPVRLVLRLPEHDLHGPDHLVARPILGDQKDALAGHDALGDAPPERVGLLPRQRRHVTDGVAALQAVDQVSDRSGILSLASCTDRERTTACSVMGAPQRSVSPPLVRALSVVSAPT